MTIIETDRAHAFHIDPPPAGVFDPRLAAMEIGAFHKTHEPFALEVTSGRTGGAFFVRTEKPRSAVVSYLSLACGTAAVPAHEDWLTLRPDETALVRAIALTHHTVLPTVGYSERQVQIHWATIRGHMNATMERCGGRYGVRTRLQQASDEWRVPFEKELASRPAQGDGGGGWFRRHDSRSGTADIDPQMAATKLNGPAFYAEIQVIAICAESRHRREVGAELEKLVGFVVELAGGDKAWKPTTRQEIAGKTLFRGRRDRNRLQPWPLAAFLSPRQASQYVLSPQEVAPLWPAPLSLPKPLAAEALALAPPQPAPESTRDTLPDSTTNTVPPVPPPNEPRGTDIALESDVEDGLIKLPIPGTIPPAARRQTRWGTSTGHSARPSDVALERGPDRRQLRRENGKGTPDSGRRQAAKAAAQSSTVRELELTESDIALFDQVGDMPWASVQDLAYAFDHNPGTVYQKLHALNEHGLVEAAKFHIGATREMRFTVSDDNWSRVMHDRPLPHKEHVLQRLLINLEFTTAVYLLVGLLVQGERGRKLLRLRWLWRHDFDAIAQFNDGWAGFLWSGMWQDQEKLERRIQQCAEVLAEWSGGRGTHWPGRLVIVVPDQWQEEVAWRAVRRRGWEAICSVHCLVADTFAGDLDLTASRGRIPMQLSDDVPPVRAGLEQLQRFLLDDQGDRMRRLLSAVEQYPGIIASHVSAMSGINGQLTKLGLAELQRRELTRRMGNQGYALEKRPLALAARRDRVWLGLPDHRSGPNRLSAHSGRRWKRIRGAQKLLAQFRAAGCPTAAGWRAQDGPFVPDGVVWIEDGPCGRGWHYLINASGIRAESMVDRLLEQAFARARSDRYPILVVCPDALEQVYWHAAPALPVLTAAMSRVSGGPVVGDDGTVWMKSGVPVKTLAAPGT